MSGNFSSVWTNFFTNSLISLTIFLVVVHFHICCVVCDIILELSKMSKEFIPWSLWRAILSLYLKYHWKLRQSGEIREKSLERIAEPYFSRKHTENCPNQWTLVETLPNSTKLHKILIIVSSSPTWHFIQEHKFLFELKSQINIQSQIFYFSNIQINIWLGSLKKNVTWTLKFETILTLIQNTHTNTRCALFFSSLYCLAFWFTTYTGTQHPSM